MFRAHKIAFYAVCTVKARVERSPLCWHDADCPEISPQKGSNLTWAITAGTEQRTELRSPEPAR